MSLKNFVMVKETHYKFKDIEKFQKQENYTIEELGMEIIGCNFLILTSPKEDIIISFMLSGVMNVFIQI